jgi:fatty-acyl-CoA synthase
MLQGLTSDYQLTLPTILQRAETLYGRREIVTRRPDKSFHRHTYADFVRRAKKLAVAIEGLGLESGDRVGTLCWNTYQHLEAYFGIPSSGAVLHTINPRLFEEDLAYIVDHAEDRVLIVDEVLFDIYEKFRERVNVEHVIFVSRTKRRRKGRSPTKICSQAPTRAASSTRTSTRSRRRRSATPPGRRGGPKGRSTLTGRSCCTR